METKNYLGIYLGLETATVICLNRQGRQNNIVSCFSVSIEDTDYSIETAHTSLADLIAKGCAERELRFSEVSIAVDCKMFMQHNVHSEFKDQKQIAATVRFDTEEALATDIADVAIAFKKTTETKQGSELTVFTAEKKLLSPIITALQANNIDPVTVEPDINCLSRFIQQTNPAAESAAFYAMLSIHNGYFLIPTSSESEHNFAMRTFLISPTQDRTDLLASQIPVTAALLSSDDPIGSLKIFDSTDSASRSDLTGRLGFDADTIDLIALTGIDKQYLDYATDPIHLAIAYGAAIAHSDKTSLPVDFRRDFMPFQGKKMRLQKTLKFLSIAVTFLLLAVSIFLQIQLMHKNAPRTTLRKKFEKQYSTVMLGVKPPSKANPVKKLAGELRRIQNVKSGKLNAMGEESVTTKLTLVLEAFNKCAANTKLNIESIGITSKSISIVGSTSSRKNTLKFRKALEEGKLKIQQDNLELKNGRDNFRISIALK